jgi:tape measure domain-containing protein
VAKLTIQLGATIGKLKKGLASARSEVKNWSKRMGKLGKVALGVGVGAFAAGLATLTKRAVTLAAAFQQTQVAFNAMLGDSQKAASLIEALTEFSTKTPFSPEKVQQAAKTLLSFGFTADEVKKTLKPLGDVAAGTGKDFQELAVIFGQIKSAGRLMGQDLLQLINAGFNPLQVMSEKTGKSVSQLKDEMSKGLITFQQVEQAFIDATSAGGLFNDMMAKQSETVIGKVSTLKGNFDELLKTMAAGTTGPLSKFVGKLNEVVVAFQDIEKAREAASGEGVEVDDVKLADRLKAAAVRIGKGMEAVDVFDVLPDRMKRGIDKVESELMESATGRLELAAPTAAEKEGLSAKAQAARDAAKVAEQEARFADINKRINEQISQAVGDTSKAVGPDLDFNAIEQISKRFNLSAEEVANQIEGGAIRVSDILREFGGEFGVAIAGLADEDFAETAAQSMARVRKEILAKARREVEKQQAEEAMAGAKTGLRDAIAVNRERAGELEKSIAASFRPQGEIASNLARIGGERGISLGRNVPEKQLQELKGINDGIKILEEQLKNLDQQKVFP